ncbi:MAG: LysE family transporter [Candidatus Lokiarchaeota archaeon]|nr:LysE family transporter [Candidatus Lokiarchaeota archaeon]
MSFLVALTGALSPGPLLTFTIFRSLKAKKGYMVGLFISLGHATLEFILIIALLFGASIFLQNELILTIIGVIGSVLLIIFGILIILDLYYKSLDSSVGKMNEDDIKGFKGNSFLGGLIVSLSNPYWTLWWAVIGLGLMINYNISFQDPGNLVLFYLGHELGDLAWYWPISIFVYYSGRSLNKKVYSWILIICGIFMIGFGIYLGMNIIFFNPL